LKTPPRDVTKVPLARTSQDSDALHARGVAMIFCAHDSLGILKGPALNRSNILYLIMGALVIAVAVMGYQLYQDRHPPEGMQINIGPGGLSIQGK